MYTDKQILDRLKVHLIDERGSVFNMHKPSWEGIKKRMKKDADFAAKVEDCRAEADHLWWKWGLDNIDGSNPDFNTGLFKFFCQNKIAFRDHTAIELEERIAELENGKS